MQFGKTLKALSGIVRGFVQRRGVSEYSKRMGYKPKDLESAEGKVNVPEIAFCVGLIAYFIYDITKDRREHLKALMKNFDKREKYYDHRAGLGIPPPMDFLLDKLYNFPQGELDKPHDSMETTIPEKLGK